MIQVEPKLIDAERILVASMMVFPTQVVKTVRRFIDARDFIDPIAASLASEIFDASEIGDMVSIGELFVTAPKEIMSLVNFTVTAENRVAGYAEYIRQASLRRKVRDIGAKLSSIPDTSDASGIVAEMRESIDRLVRDTSDNEPVSVSDVSMSMLDTWIKPSSAKRDLYLPTGIRALDDILVGMGKGQLVIVGARPAIGKSAFALSVSRHIAITRGNVGYISLEMDADSLVTRYLSMETGISGETLQFGTLTSDDESRLRENVAALTLGAGTVYIDAKLPLMLPDLRERVRTLVENHKCSMVVVDYLAQISHPSMRRNRNEQVGDISRRLKEVAMEFGIIIMALMQLNRDVESRQFKRPALSDLRESGNIEQDADVVLLLHRPEAYNIDTFDDGSSSKGLAEIIVAKRRNGRTGSAICGFIANRTLYADVSPRTVEYNFEPPTHYW